MTSAARLQFIFEVHAFGAKHGFGISFSQSLETHDSVDW
jgi:hypothetical protein